MYGGYGTASPPASNNPFLNANDPTHASSRYPAISTSTSPDASSQYLAYQQQQSQFGPYQQQPQYAQSQYGVGSYGTNPSMSASQFGVSSPTGTFHPSSAFGQQLAATSPTISGSSYSYLSGQQTAVPQQQTLSPAQQQLQSPSYVAQFDPYSSLGQWDGTGAAQQQQQRQQYQQQQQYNNGGMYPGIASPLPTTGVSPTGEPHPREYLRTHKAQIEAWDKSTWTQLLKTFEFLKTAWNLRKETCEKRMKELESQIPQYNGYYQQQYQLQAEFGRVTSLRKEAESNFDSVAASLFQMEEVFQGYRQSGDAASKRRVREATNAAMSQLPDWPPSTI